MKVNKVFVIVLLALCLEFVLAGCAELKESILDGYNNLLQFSSEHALTKESKLQGEKTSGTDTYTGSYTAEYENFDGEEYIFGGTGLKREAGNELTATYTLKITSGSASLIWIHSGSEYTIINADGGDTREFTIGSGDNYFALRGEDFTGTFTLDVE